MLKIEAAGKYQSWCQTTFQHFLESFYQLPQFLSKKTWHNLRNRHYGETMQDALSVKTTVEMSE